MRMLAPLAADACLRQVPRRENKKGLDLTAMAYAVVSPSPGMRFRYVYFFTGMKGCSFTSSSGAVLYLVLPKFIEFRSISRMALLYIVR